MITDEGVKLAMTCRYVPLQYEGTVDDYPAYFRARGTGWTFTIARTMDAAIGGLHFEPDSVLFDTGGEVDTDGCGFCAGYMEAADAERLIVDAAERFRMTVRQRIPAATTDQGAGSEE